MFNGSVYTFMLENCSGFGSFLQTDTTVSLVDYIDESVLDAVTITGDAMATEWLTGDETLKLFQSNGQWYAAVALGAEGGIALFEVEDDGTGSDGELTYISPVTGTDIGTESDFDILDFDGITYIGGANAAQNSLYFYYVHTGMGELIYGGDLSSGGGRSLDDVARIEIISPTNPAYETGYIIAAGPTDGVSLIDVSNTFPELAHPDVASIGMPDEIAVYEVDGTIYLYSVDETSGVMWVYSIDPTTNTFVYKMGQNLLTDSGLSSVDVTDISFLDYGAGTLMAVGLEDTEALLLYSLDSGGTPVLLDVVPSSEINDVVSVELVEFDGVPYVAVVETDLGFISLFEIGENGDLIAAKGTNDEPIGLGGDDTLLGYDGADLINGGSGADTIYSGAGDDVLRGADGYDTIDGGGDNDTLYGGNHDDILQGGSGNDTLYGQADDDRIDGGLGNDDLYGGTGADTFVLAGTFGDDVIHDFTDGEDLIDLSGTSGLLSMVDVVSNWIQLGDDVMIADGGNPFSLRTQILQISAPPTLCSDRRI
ncbi:calcium-binding protein [uncultured Celeribacter sp.]|uniref:calcium-binding protein n=1 Tax=uncultured Celeribacter sp. TaxID=1303376 RepID=UPI002AA78CE2|nr:calcium-binding protein [uncultured Celeribacter sp.]